MLNLALLLTIVNPTGYPVDTTMLEEEFQLALSHFRKEVGVIRGETVISIAPESCLRTGYHRPGRRVIFCPGKNVKEMGLWSPDVIRHELFHAFLCELRPELCSGVTNEALHEALADTFAYRLSPDENFGEGFYLDRNFIRSYKTNWRPGLVQGPHEKGSALAAQFIQSGVKIRELLSLFDQAESPEEVKDQVTGVPYSRLNRYRLKIGQSMEIEFRFARAAKVESVEWILPQEIRMTKKGQLTYELELREEIPPIKGYARFLSAEGKELGRRTYYFGLK